MAKEDYMEFEGVVEEVLRGATFKVRLPNDHIITAYISGNLRRNYIKIMKNDKVTVEVPIQDFEKGRIVWRAK